MTTSALAGRTTQAALLLAVPQLKQAASATSQAVLLVAFAPPSALLSTVSEVAALVTTAAEGKTVPGTSQVAMLIAYATGTPGESRSRAWSYTMDGHTFYVLNLRPEGT